MQMSKVLLLLLFGAVAAGTAPAAQMLVVTNRVDGAPGSLRAAIGAASGVGTTFINFAPNLVCNTLTLTNELVIGHRLAINGPGAAWLALNPGQHSRIFHILPGITVTISNLTLVNGQAVGRADLDGLGGAIYNEGTLSLVNCQLSRNGTLGGATSPTDGLGGAIYSSGTIMMTNCSLTDNTAVGGGSNPWGAGYGGSIYTIGPLVMVNCTISGNGAYGGRDVFNGGIVGGGGIRSLGNLTLVSCTIVSNGAYSVLLSPFISSGGGLSVADQSTSIVRSTIIVSNLANSGPDVFGTVSSQGHNLIGLTDDSSGWTSGDLFGLDPKLGPLRFYGGQTRCHALLPESPAIDHGDDIVLNYFTTDQRGYPRKTGAHVDIGAFETNSANYQVHACAALPDFPHSLREILAEISNGDKMSFSPDITGTYFADGELVIDKSIDIVGPGAAVLTLSGDGYNRLFQVASNASVNISGLTIANGISPSGGAISNAGTLTVNDCVLSNNTASGTFPKGSGGAIYNVGGLTLNRCTVVSNTAALDGGAILNDGVLQVLNSTLAGNIATHDGGAIYHLDGSSTLQNCTIASNYAASTSLPPGGGIYAGFCSGANCSPWPPQVWVANCIIAANRAFGGDYAGPVVSVGYNLVGDGGYSVGFGSTGDQVGTGPAPLDPMLGPLQDNGGPTPTMALLPDSPAINRGYSPSLLLDQRGGRRPVYATLKLAAGDGSDIGAYERDGLLRTTAIDRLAPTGIRLSFWSEMGSSYWIEQSPTLNGGAWSPLTDNVAGAGGVVQVVDPDSMQPQRFYRVRLLP
jgi:hypothetical protein